MARKEETDAGLLELAHTGSKILQATDSLKLAMVGTGEYLHHGNRKMLPIRVLLFPQRAG